MTDGLFDLPDDYTGLPTQGDTVSTDAILHTIALFMSSIALGLSLGAVWRR